MSPNRATVLVAVAPVLVVLLKRLLRGYTPWTRGGEPPGFAVVSFFEVFEREELPYGR